MTKQPQQPGIRRLLKHLEFLHLTSALSLLPEKMVSPRVLLSLRGCTWDLQSLLDFEGSQFAAAQASAFLWSRRPPNLFQGSMLETTPVYPISDLKGYYIFIYIYDEIACIRHDTWEQVLFSSNSRTNFCASSDVWLPMIIASKHMDGTTAQPHPLLPGRKRSRGSWEISIWC